MKFWQTDRGKVISYGIHEHNSGLGLAHWNLKKLTDSNNLTSEQSTYIQNIRENLEKMQKSMDYVYEKLKSLEGF